MWRSVSVSTYYVSKNYNKYVGNLFLEQIVWWKLIKSRLQTSILLYSTNYWSPFMSSVPDWVMWFFKVCTILLETVCFFYNCHNVNMHATNPLAFTNHRTTPGIQNVWRVSSQEVENTELIICLLKGDSSISKLGLYIYVFNMFVVCLNDPYLSDFLDLLSL